MCVELEWSATGKRIERVCVCRVQANVGFAGLAIFYVLQGCVTSKKNPNKKCPRTMARSVRGIYYCPKLFSFFLDVVVFSCRCPLSSGCKCHHTFVVLCPKSVGPLNRLIYTSKCTVQN